MKRSRRLVFGALAGSILPTLLGVALVRPASAGTGAPLGRFNITANAAAVTTSGSLAAEGGLVLTDQGLATVTGTLDSSPSAKTTAVTGEPGSTVRTLLGSSGVSAPPGAEAQYPGGPATNSASDVGAPVDTDTADAGMLTADATASVASGSGATATETMSANADDSQLAATAASHSGEISIAGVLDIGAVVGSVSLGYDGTGHHSSASVTVAGATIGGQAVSIDAGGIHVLGVSPVPGGLIPTTPPEPVASLLAAAGISVSVLAPVMTTDAHGAYADSGALVIHETTPDLTSGATGFSSASDVTLYLGEATATLLDAPADAIDAVPEASVSASASPAPAEVAAPASSAVSAAPFIPGKPAVPGRVVTTVVGGAPPGALAAAPVTPVVAAAPAGPAQPAVLAPPRQLQVLGYRLDASSALAGFGAWQLLTLGIATTGVMLARRRTDDDEEHLCPCP